MARWISLLGAFMVVMMATSQPQQLPLLAYVAQKDDAFSWQKVSSDRSPLGVTFHELRLTSQRWKGMVWRHTLLIAQPPKVATDLALLVIAGGKTDSRGDSQSRLLASAAAIQLQALVAVLYAVPNQPLFDGLVEDDLIAHTFVKFLETGDLQWAALLPMTKSAVKAMDAVQQFAAKELNLTVNGFVVTGASKRGWTTWLTAVADPQRVKGIAPMVYDNLNIPAQMRHQREVFGGYSEQISEYTQRGLTDLADTEKARPLVQLIDPYAYLDRLTMPKLIINGTNDRYWALDAANFYFDDLRGEKYILYVPNSGHGLEDVGRVVRAVMAFFDYLAQRLTFPKLQWTWTPKDGGMTLTVRSDPMPKQVLLWRATAPTKDFRDAKWESQELTATDGAFLFTLTPPEKGYAAAFAELVYEGNNRTYSLCTTIRIVGK
jgi:PhoPQ-activated pathogenicity-related protein